MAYYNTAIHGIKMDYHELYHLIYKINLKHLLNDNVSSACKGLLHLIISHISQ